MVKTTIYLSDELRRRIKRTAQERATSEAEVIRGTLDAGLPPLERPRPRLPLFNSGRGDLAERWDELMEGFGKD